MTNDFDEQYEQFLAAHKNTISSALKEKYFAYQSDFSSCFWQNMDFGGKIGLPLFVAWGVASIFIARGREDYVFILLTIAFLALFVWLKYVWDIIEQAVCEHFFIKYERKQIILQYVATARAARLRNARSEEERIDIDAFFDRCSHYIVDELFVYC